MDIKCNYSKIKEDNLHFFQKNKKKNKPIPSKWIGIWGKINCGKYSTFGHNMKVCRSHSKLCYCKYSDLKHVQYVRWLVEIFAQNQTLLTSFLIKIACSFFPFFSFLIILKRNYST